MLSMIKDPLHRLGRSYIARITKSEYESQRFLRINERPIEYRFVFECLTKTCARRVLDVGSGDTALPHMLRNCGCIVTAIDNVEEYWPSGMVNRHWYVIHDDICRPKLQGRFDMITCVSVIEHIEKHLDAFKGMFQLLEHGGYLALTTPYSDNKNVPNVYKEPGSAYGQDLPYICRSSSQAELRQWMESTQAEIIVQEYWKCWTGEFWTQGQKLDIPVQVKRDDVHQLTCILFRKPECANRGQGTS